MKFSFGKKPSDNNKTTILFVCVQNAERSQMAEGFFRKYAHKGFECQSAGTVPTSQINPIAIEAMKEVGIDISNQKPKDLTEDMMRNAASIINMGCMDDKFCPALFVPKVIDWGD
jgi:arsenate reductase (thioredoxin)